VQSAVERLDYLLYGSVRSMILSVPPRFCAAELTANCKVPNAMGPVAKLCYSLIRLAGLASNCSQVRQRIRLARAKLTKLQFLGIGQTCCSTVRSSKLQMIRRAPLSHPIPHPALPNTDLLSLSRNQRFGNLSVALLYQLVHALHSFRSLSAAIQVRDEGDADC